MTRGMEADDAQAVQWYRKAAEQGDADAQFKLGWMYRNGRGVEADDAQAMQWYRKAAEQGHTHAKAALGSKCEAGVGDGRDVEANEAPKPITGPWNDAESRNSAENCQQADGSVQVTTSRLLTEVKRLCDDLDQGCTQLQAEFSVSGAAAARSRKGSSAALLHLILTCCARLRDLRNHGCEGVNLVWR